MLSRLRMCATIIAASAMASGASATTFIFESDPFLGSTALTTPGRQIVGGEPSISFNIATDQFAFDQAFFAVGSDVVFANALVENLATSGLNVIVLQTLDNDANAGTPFGAGNAANLMAAQITADGAGFFIYFNSGLDLPRLVYSTNLSDPAADLAVLARMTNLSGNTNALPQFTAANFEIRDAVPEPATWAMLLLGFGATGLVLRRQKRRSSPRLA